MNRRNFLRSMVGIVAAGVLVKTATENALIPLPGSPAWVPMKIKRLEISMTGGRGHVTRNGIDLGAPLVTHAGMQFR